MSPIVSVVTIVLTSNKIVKHQVKSIELDTLEWHAESPENIKCINTGA